MTDAAGGFGVDRDALTAAIKDLEDARDEAWDLENEAHGIEPGELTAQDRNTALARQMFQDRMTGADASLRSSANDIRLRLQEKIDAYKATLGEYERAEDNADADVQRSERQA